MIRRRVVGLLIGLLVGGVLLVPANANLTNLYTMQELLDGAYFAVGDKIIDDWHYEVTGTGFASDPTEITVKATWDEGAQKVWLDYQTAYLADEEEWLDVLWDYRVSTVSERPLIEDVSVILAAFSTRGEGQISLSETIWEPDIGGTAVAAFSVTQDDPTGEAWFDPLSQIRVQKNLLLLGGGTPVQENQAHVSRILQDISQVPEASTYALFGLGLVGMGLFRRFRNR